MAFTPQSQASSIITHKDYIGNPLPSYQQHTRKEGEVKIVLLGDSNVGKTALTVRFVANIFPENYDPTVEDSYRIPKIIDNETVLLEIVDTSGQFELKRWTEEAIKRGDGFLICYSIDNRYSFLNINKYKKLIGEVFPEGIRATVLMGNKADLDDPLHRKISRDEGQALAHSMSCPFFETSAARDCFVDDAFLKLIREIRKKQKEKCESKTLGWWKRFKSILLPCFK